MNQLALRYVFSALVMFLGTTAWSADITVTSVANSGAGSLRQAVASAASGDRILFASSLNGQAIILTSGLVINKSLTLEGNGPTATVISGGGATRVMEVTGGGLVTVRDLSIIDGRVVGEGGGLLVTSTNVTLISVYIDGNEAGGVSGRGGGIYLGGTSALSMTRSKLRHNTAGGQGGGLWMATGTQANLTTTEVNDNLVSRLTLGASRLAGGGIHNAGGQLTIEQTTVAYNSAPGGREMLGGGVATGAAGTLSVDRSTITGNTVGGTGGGIYAESGATITRATIINNQAANGGGYTHAAAPQQQVILTGTALTNNIGPITNPDFLLLSGLQTSGGYNLIGSDTAGQFTQRTTDTEGVDGLFQPLTDNGGVTLTHLPETGSPAVNRGNPEDQTRDQLGKPVYSGQRDIGAVEASPRIYYADFDGDGLGDPNTFAYGENQPQNYVENELDNCPSVANLNQEDTNGDGVGDACETESVEKDEFFLAAECAELSEQSKFIIRADGAGGEVYAVYIGPNSNSAPPPDNPQNYVRFVVPNAIAGSYNLFARVRAPNTGADSYWVRLNNGPWIRWWQGLTTTTFAWKEVVEGPYNLQAGRNTIDFAYREPNTELEKIQLSMGGSLPTDGAGGSAYSCEAVVVLEDRFSLEAECASVGSAFLTYPNTNASEGRYVKFTGTRSMDTPPPDVPANRVRFDVPNATAGYYNLFARLRAPDGNSDSFWVRVNEGEWKKWASGLITTTFAWKEVIGNSYLFREGYNYIDIAYREPNAELDKLYFAIGGVSPTDTGPPATNACN